MRKILRIREPALRWYLELYEMQKGEKTILQVANCKLQTENRKQQNDKEGKVKVKN